LVGAALLIPLQTFANSLFGGEGQGLTFILYGGIIILLSRFEPGGLLEIRHHYLARKSRKGRAA
jgi:branched-chain amino acid transport system permease protein